MTNSDRDAEGAHTENRMSGSSGRIELITRGERRRSWTVEQKREIAVASLAPGAVTASIARQHEIGTGLLYTWRKQLLSGELGAAPSLVPRFLRIDVGGTLPQPPHAEGRSILEAPCASSSAASTGYAVARPKGLIEILLPGGVSLRVDAQVDGAALRRVVAALEGK